MESIDLIDKCKKEAARLAIEENVKNNMKIGIGSGSTVVFAIKRLAEIVKKNKWNVICVPTSYQSEQLIIENGLNLGTLNQYPELDIDFDGADEIDEKLNLIKGGGGCLVQEKIAASYSKKVIIIADFRKKSKYLGENWKKGIPIEIIPGASIPIMKKIENLGGVPKLRMGIAKMGPVVTDNNNFIIDADFNIIKDPGDLDKKLLSISGVVDTGFFLNMASMVYIGKKDGSVEKIMKK
jgi:ribose 5-phosphate isomerase A